MGQIPGYMDGGFKCKYRVEKVDASPVDPQAHYFVLRFDKDPHARVAMRAYAESVRDVNPGFADDIEKILAATVTRFRQTMIDQCRQRTEGDPENSEA